MVAYTEDRPAVTAAKHPPTNQTMAKHPTTNQPVAKHPPGKKGRYPLRQSIRSRGRARSLSAAKHLQERRPTTMAAKHSPTTNQRTNICGGISSSGKASATISTITNRVRSTAAGETKASRDDHNRHSEGLLKEPTAGNRPILQRHV